MKKTNRFTCSACLVAVCLALAPLAVRAASVGEAGAQAWFDQAEARIAILAAVLLVLVAAAGLLRLQHRRSDTELRRAHALLARTAQVANMGGWALDLDTRVLHWSDQAHVIHGTDSRTFVPTPERTLEFYPVESRRVLRERMLACIRQGESFCVELELHRADGEPIWVRVSGEPERQGGRISRIFGILQDIDAFKRQQLALQRSERLYRTLADNVTDLIALHRGPQGEIAYVTPSVRRLSGYGPEELVGRSFLSLLHPDDVARVAGNYAALVAGEHVEPGAFRVRHRSGGYRWIESHGQVVQGETSGAQEYLIISRDVTERVQSEQRYRHLAFHDALTGLPNRAALITRLEEAIGRARTGDSAVALLFLDTDHFKQINDSRGHSAGDEFLRRISARLHARLGRHACVARLGGDEFVALFEDRAACELAVRAAAELVDSFAEPLPIAGDSVYSTASIGVACFPEDGDSAEALLAAADTAMYAAKEAGRNTWRHYDRTMGKTVSIKAQTLHNLRNAFDAGQLLLHYQPKVDLDSGHCGGVEALLRWQTPEGLVGPSGFIEAAEASGFIQPLGQWVIETAAEQSRAWRAAGITATIAVNVSIKQLQGEQFIAHLREQVERDPDLARFLELEITESALAVDPEHALRVLGELRTLGFALHIDDFGTGYSSLANLSRMPVGALKIDRSFVSGLPEARDACEIVRAIMALARSLNLQVVAEGVETAAQAAFLRTLGCDRAQGYHFARPAAADQVAQLLQARSTVAPATRAPRRLEAIHLV